MERKHSWRFHLLNRVQKFTAFSLTLYLLPSFLFCYVYTKLARKLWLKILNNKFPFLNFDETISIRTLLDNYRNQGIINVLLTIKGNCQPDLIRQAYFENIIEKRDEYGNFLYPKLRAGLVSRWGNYAWNSDISFNSEKHLLFGKSLYRGRPITDHNIQEYVNDIITRYLPTSLPPWQIIIIPNIVSNEQKYCILVRVHHLLVSHGEPLQIADFLPLKLKADLFASCELAESDFEKNPMSEIIQRPKSLPKLYNIMCDSLSNSWNEFISEYDPIESPRLTKTSLDFFHCIAIILIAFVSICKELNKSLSLRKNDPIKFVRLYISMFYREISRRSLTSTIMMKSIWITFNPLKVFTRILKCSLMIMHFFTIKLSKHFYNEIKVFYQHRKNISHLSCMYSFNYFPLVSSSIKEIITMSKIVYAMPINLISELFLKNNEVHQLQNLSLCGRKVVSWSHSISEKIIKEISMKANVSETELLINMTSNCLKEYFRYGDFTIPKTILVIAKTSKYNFATLPALRKKSTKIKKDDGIICLSLPVGLNLKPAEEFDYIRRLMSENKETQAVIYSLGAYYDIIMEALPSLLSRVLLNFLSRKFSITITEIIENTNSECYRTEWEQNVHSILTWKPPQGNIRMSIILQRYAGSVRMGIMADAQLAPYHVAITKHWNKALKRLGSEYGISFK